MTISKKEIDKRIEWQFEFYKERLVETKFHEYQKDEYNHMRGVISAMLSFGLINEEKCNKLWDRATKIYRQTELPL